MTALFESAPTAMHRGEDELPFVTLPDTGDLQVIRVDLAHGLWVVRNRFQPGTTIPRHRHTGHVDAFTISGSWHYLESPEAVNTAGSYLFEPAGSVHTLHVPETNEGVTDVWFAIHGCNLNLDDDGNVVMVIDAQLTYDFYKAMCLAEHGIEDPPVVVVNT